MRQLGIIVLLFVANISIAQTINVNSKGEPFSHYWSVGVGAGRVNEGLRASWQEHLSLAKEHCGFQYVRMHGLFHDDMFTYFEDKNGNAKYNWQYVDDVYDRLLAKGVRPFVELAFFPLQMSKQDGRKQFWWKANVELEESTYAKWYGLVKAFTQHVVDRYGLDEVKKWYFEVWNEPNLYNGFFHNTRSEYFRLYKESAKAVKAVDASLRIGGPATSNFIPDSRHDGEIQDNSLSRFYPQSTINIQQWKGIWIEDFLQYCTSENLPVDFVSCHPYPTDYALDPETGRSKGAIRYAKSLFDDLTWLRGVISKSKYKDAEIHLTEWSSSPNGRDAMHDMLPAAIYIIKVSLDCINMTNSLMYWTFTDVFEEKGGQESVFQGGFGMINYQGIVKPTFHAFRMLHKLGDEKLFSNEYAFVSRTAKTGKISAIIYNYPKEYDDRVPSAGDGGHYMEASEREADLVLKGLPAGAEFDVEVLDDTHGNSYKAYERMGKPRNLTIRQTEELKQSGWATIKQKMKADAKGRLVIKQKLAPWTCICITEK